MKFTLLASLVLAISARPNGSPLCVVAGADTRIAGGMGANTRDLKALNDYTLSISSTAAVSGRSVVLTINGTEPFIGILLYAVGSEPNERIGKWKLQDGAQGNPSCGAQTLQDPTSVITFSSGAEFPARTQFQYEIPSTGFSGEINFNAIIMRRDGSSFSWGVYENAASMTGTASLKSGEEAPASGALKVIGAVAAAVSTIMMFV
jgi:hypothetical protein